MKKTLIAILLAVLAVGTASAQDVKLRKRYFNLGYAPQNMYDATLGKTSKVKADWGVGLSNGRYFILHKEPVAGMLHFGIDATWCDFNYARFGKDLTMHRMDLGAGVGVGIHLTPVGALGIHTYARYNPTCTLMGDWGEEETFGVGYTSGLVSGLSVSWGLVSVGFEGRWNFGEYNISVWDDDDNKTTSKRRLNTTGCRIYFGFRW